MISAKKEFLIQRGVKRLSDAIGRFACYGEEELINADAKLQFVNSTLLRCGLLLKKKHSRARFKDQIITES